jgi:UDP-glucose 4-epimerase
LQTGASKCPSCTLFSTASSEKGNALHTLASQASCALAARLVTMQLVISGAAGGIGSRLANRLYEEKKYDLVLLDDLSGGHMSNLSEELQGILFVEKAEALPGLLLEKVASADVFIHLAGSSSLAKCQAEQETAFKSNFLSTVSLAEAARQAGAHFIFASTSAVYEGLDNDLYTEDLNPSPHLAYPTSKYISELHLKGLFDSYGFPSAVLRLFNVFGESQDQSRKNPPLVNYIFRQLNKGQTVKLFAPQDQSRDYVYVEDVLDAIELAINKPAESFRVLNICSGRSISISEIVAAVAFGANLKTLPIVQGNPEAIWDDFPDLFKGPYPLSKAVVESEVLKKSLGSFQKATIELGWGPKTDVLRAIREYSRQLMGSPPA